MNPRIDTAIREFGARRVHAAAIARLNGDHSKLASIGLTAPTIAGADLILTRAFKRLSAADRSADCWTVRTD